ncbi:putative sulfate exporter family transporter [Epibacterium ulvae]|uniref:YeiH family protein n=1 Tax=Epibacterium ulvae TaxID=1156985 RepID=UPI001BFBFE9C|nr:putative sulfate exporter family transporter [Epibacterium ulvae]MBT8153520.1 putative sulfate exporter family transporter [Epibacterium ulvae]
MLLTMNQVREIGPGLFMAALVAMAAQFLSDHYGAPVMLMAILLGIPFQFLSSEQKTSVGINYASRTVLRVGVALLGVRVSLDLLIGMGPTYAVLITIGVAATILLGIALSSVFSRSRAFGFLAGGAVAICGASAAMAIASLLPKHDKSESDLTFTVVCVTVASTVAMIVYPVIATALGFDTNQAGVFLGGTIHDVAQVVGAGFSMSDATGDAATLVKLFRVTMLAPVVFIGALLLRNETEIGEKPPLVPGFILAFLALAALNSAHLLPEVVANVADQISRACLVTAVAAVGMKTSIQELRTVGGSSVGLIVTLTVFLAVFIALGIWVLSH